MNDKEKIYAKLIEFCSYKPRSKKQIEDKISLLFKRYGVYVDYAEKLRAELLEMLSNDRLVDDSANVKAFVQSFISSSHPKSLRAIKSYLMGKGYSSVDIENALEGVSSDFEIDAVKKLAEKKLLSMHNGNTRSGREKLIKYLMGKGYSYSLSRTAVDTIPDLK